MRSSIRSFLPIQKAAGLILLSVAFLLSGCAASYDDTLPQLDITDSYLLPDTLAESSGLYCLENSAFTVNDSGNTATLFEIDATGTIVSETQLDKPNTDWEAVTANQNFIYIGDIGNNRGDRSNLTIEVVERDTLRYHGTLSIDYEGYQAGSNVPYAHDFDAEAMTWRDGKLLVFSKSWASRVSRVYEVDSKASTQVLKAAGYIDGLPGVITGADWDSKRQQFVIVGYASDPFGNFDTFLAEVTPGFKVSRIWPLPDHDQVEGVCAAPDGSYWVTQEAVGDSPATLLRIMSPTPF